MNATVRTILLFLVLVGAIVAASLMYRKVAEPPPSPQEPARVVVDEGDLHPELQNGMAAEREQRDDDALEHFQAVPQDSPAYPLALQRSAVILARRGEYVDAQELVYKLSQLRPDDPEPRALLGWLFFLSGEYERAELAALRTLELDPEHLSTRYNIGLYRTAQGRSQRAIASYTRAMREDPGGLEVSVHREQLQKFHDGHPDQPAAHYALAFFANSMQDRRTEIDELQHYMEIARPGPELDAAQAKIEEARRAIGEL